MKKPALIVMFFAAALAAGAEVFFNRAAALQGVAAGFASRHGLAGADAFDKILALAYEWGGVGAAATLRALSISLPVFLGLLLLTAVAGRLYGKWRRAAVFGPPALALAILIGGSWLAFPSWRLGLRDLRLLAPSGLLNKASQIEGRVFLNPHALFLAPLFAPGKIDSGATLQSASRLSASPADWRAEDRKAPYSAVVLTGQLASSAPLLDMLLSSPGWRLAAIDNHGVLLIRGGRGTDEPGIETARQLFSKPSDQAVYLAQAALVSRSAGRPESASALMRSAMELDEGNPHVMLCSAGLAAQEGRWNDARVAAEKTLASDPSSAQAARILALALFESGALAKAAERIRALAERHPEDPQVLRLQARIARADNDPATEVEALQKLLDISQKQNLPVGNLRLLLGQAWAKRGFPAQALENYNAALAENPPDDLKKQTEEAMAVIRQRSR